MQQSILVWLLLQRYNQYQERNATITTSKPQRDASSEVMDRQLDGMREAVKVVTASLGQLKRRVVHASEHAAICTWKVPHEF
jgi:hypothetical protein